MAIHYVDPEGGNNANDGLSFANRKQTLTAVTPVAGDSIRVISSPDATTLGSASWTNLSKTVVIPAGLTANIDTGATAWTASANVTAATSGTRKEGATSASQAIAAAFTTGLVAYKAFASTDFSAFRQISFWIRNSAVVAAGVFELRLCSDAAGVTAVNTISVSALPTTNDWTALTVDTGAALGAAIQSVALYALVDPGTITILLDNILACKDSTTVDSISLTSLISKNTGSETWHGIQSINGTTVLLDDGVSTLANAGQGYFGTTETVTTYIRRPLKVPMSATSQLIVQTAGTAASPVVVSGGWNRTDMSSLLGQSWLSGQSGGVDGLTAKSFQNISDLYLVRFMEAITTTGTVNDAKFTNVGANNNTNGVSIPATASHCSFTTVVTKNNNTSGVDLDGPNHTLTTLISDSNAIGLRVDADLMFSRTVTCRNNSSEGVFFSTCSLTKVYDLTTQNNGIGVLNSGNRAFLVNALIQETTEVTSSEPFSDYRVYSHKHDQTTDNHKIFTDGGLISSEVGANRRTASGMAWAISPTSANRSSTYPMFLEGMKIACAASALVTVSVWVLRTNTGISAQLFLKGGQIGGVAADVSALATGPAGTYEQISIAFTPTEAGVVDVEFRAWGGTTFTAYFDDATIVQV